MDFFNSGVEVMQKLVILIGAGLGVWGVVNLLEGYGNDNPGAKSQGMKQFMAGAGIVSDRNTTRSSIKVAICIKNKR